MIQRTASLHWESPSTVAGARGSLLKRCFKDYVRISIGEAGANCGQARLVGGDGIAAAFLIGLAHFALGLIRDGFVGDASGLHHVVEVALRRGARG